MIVEAGSYIMRNCVLLDTKTFLEIKERDMSFDTSKRELIIKKIDRNGRKYFKKSVTPSAALVDKIQWEKYGILFKNSLKKEQRNDIFLDVMQLGLQHIPFQEFLYQEKLLLNKLKKRQKNEVQDNNKH